MEWERSPGSACRTRSPARESQSAPVVYALASPVPNEKVMSTWKARHTPSGSRQWQNCMTRKRGKRGKGEERAADMADLAVLLRARAVCTNTAPSLRTQ
eukprot:2936730-Rhodomonas_salina.1